MALWANMVALDLPRNATTSQAGVNPATSGTVVAGARFTPTAGSRLVLVAEAGASTIPSVPTGWTAPATNSAVSNTGLYVWHRVAAGGDTFTVTTGTTNQSMIVVLYEFAAGSTFLACASATGASKTAGAGPTLTLAAGTKLVIAAAGQAFASTTGSASYASWGNAAVEHVDTFVVQNGTAGYAHGQAYIEDSTATSLNVATTLTSTSTNNVERLLFAVQVAGAAAATPRPVVRAMLQAVNRSNVY